MVGCVLYEKRDEIAIVRLNRPSVLNATNKQLWIDLQKALEKAEVDEGVKVLLVTGEGRAFSAGADLKESRERTPAEYKAYLIQVKRILKKMIHFKKPTIRSLMATL